MNSLCLFSYVAAITVFLTYFTIIVSHSFVIIIVQMIYVCPKIISLSQSLFIESDNYVCSNSVALLLQYNNCVHMHGINQYHKPLLHQLCILL